MNTPRLKKLADLLTEHQLDYLAVIPGYTMRYLTGLNFHLNERPLVALFNAGGAPPALIAPDFECAIIADKTQWRLFPWQDEDGPEQAFRDCAKALNLSQKRLGIEPLNLRYYEYNLLNSLAPGTHISPADSLITAMRVHKDEAELTHIKAAITLAESVLEATLPKIKIGMTEKEVAAKLLIGLLQAGSETVPFEPLVQTGVSGAAPHAHAGDRVLAEGDLLIIDFGARVNGYISDITRTFAVGQVSDQARRIYNLVKEANQAGREAGGPGVACQMVDRASRAVIDNGDYGKYFIHRTGHGIGLEGHEPPYMVEGNAQLLAPGMTFTVEPGIYVPGFGGARIEDNVLITPNGAESLTAFSRELITVG